MPSPGFNVPETAAIPPAGDLYFDASVAVKNPAGETLAGNPGHADHANYTTVPPLMFGAGKYTASGEAVTGPAVNPAATTRGHWSEVLNFHGSPAPWVLIGILLVAGVLQLEAKGKLGRARAGVTL